MENYDNYEDNLFSQMPIYDAVPPEESNTNSLKIDDNNTVNTQMSQFTQDN